MDIQQIKDIRNELIVDSNLEWQAIRKLCNMVQHDFREECFLTMPTFENVLQWKLHDQPGQVKKIRTTCTESILEHITRCYCEVQHPNDEFNLRIKVQVLSSIPWVGIGVVSAIMALHQPDLYSSIDPGSWSVLFGREKKTLSNSDYLVYLKKVRELSGSVGCDVLETDYVLMKMYELG